MGRPPFLNAHLRGEPVGVKLPFGGLYGVVGFLMQDDGIDFMDDAFLDPWPTRHANHHLSGIPQFDGPLISLNGCKFYALDGDEADGWRSMFRTKDTAEVRRAAEVRLKELF